jgi:LacI family transcriptional regulator
MHERKIALLMGLDDHYDRGIARGIVRYAKTRENWTLFGCGWMFSSLRRITGWSGDGVIARIESAETADTLASLGIPVVDVAGAWLRPEIFCCTNDDLETGKRVGKFFLDRGFESFAFCGVREVGWSRKRLEGLLSGAGADERSVPSFEETLPWWETLDADNRLGDWIGSLTFPIAVFAANDTIGLKLIRTCRHLGIPVPDSVAVIGVDNEDILCELASPTLSSVRLDTETIGYTAAGMLDGLFSGVPGPALVPPGALVERESTNTLAWPDPAVNAAMRYLRMNGTGKIGVPDIVRAASVSRRSLEIRFRAATGSTIHDKLIEHRLREAARLLKTSELKVSAVAEAAGFSTLQRFYRLFERSYGVTPAEYRKG